MNNFDWVFYVNFYTDIKVANINTKEKAIEHYKTHGSIENRKIQIDIEKYLKNNDIYGEILFSSINDNSMYGITHSFLIYLLKECQLTSNSTILEIGCGIACLSLPIIKYINNGKYYGIDTNKTCIDWCCHHITPLCNTTFKSVSSSHFIIPCEDCELDTVYSTTIFLALTIDDITKYLTEINRVLKKGGCLIFTLFVWNQSVQMLLKTKKIKTRIIKTNGLSYLINARGEQAIIHNDTTLYKCLQDKHFEIIETIFGHWSNSSNSNIYQDVICAVKNN